MVNFLKRFVFLYTLFLFILFLLLYCLKGIVHPKMTILSSFTHPQVVPNLYTFICSAEHKRRCSEECGKQSSIFFPTMEVNGAPERLCFPHSSEHLPLCSAEQINVYRLGTTWGWVNDDRIVIFGWTISLMTWCFVKKRNQKKTFAIHARKSWSESNDSQTHTKVMIWIKWVANPHQSPDLNQMSRKPTPKLWSESNDSLSEVLI